MGISPEKCAAEFRACNARTRRNILRSDVRRNVDRKFAEIKQRAPYVAAMKEII
jgi:hypothetical protein